ncbi:uncharacterized protein DSM5745_03445 [Aspergillus mulundensis]|uniref:DUF6604 domain-containing protein n=1 Tax=Aspergillus mulundensis TaxID=1810919 RepID=A0A3D8SKG8_9EURO|nr:hypothetical protein DSM5745_03445 [Aspergillus mulundensis]RDW86803.1 hypothetical protein DSM5745_03445 [Aspergillus mulundensis]
MKDSCYQEYKKHTDYVAEWLIDTAKRCGHWEAALTPPPTPAKSYLQKPNKGAESELVEPVAGVYKLVIEDYSKLAYFIASKCPARQTASFHIFFTILDRCIELRKKHNSSYPSFYKSSATHQHFIEELIKVRVILKPSECGVSSHGPAARGRVANDNISLPNRFSQLFVREPTKSHPPEPSLASLPQSPRNVTYEAGVNRESEEGYSSFASLIRGYKSIRCVILETWMGYRQGTYSLTAASLTTDTALDLLKNAEDVTKPFLDKVGGFEQMVKHQAQSNLVEYGNEKHIGCLETFMCPEVYKETKWLFPLWPIYMFLLRVLKALGKGLSREELDRCCSFTGCRHGDYDATSDISVRVTFLGDQEILKEALLEVFSYTKISPVPVEDRLTKDLKVMFKTRKISLSLLFGVQTFLDIHYSLEGVYVGRGFEDLSEFSALVRDTISSTRAYHKSHGVPVPDALAGRDINSLINEIVRLQRDPLRHLWGRDDLSHNYREPHKLFKLHPLLSGTWLSSIKARFHEIGINFLSTYNVALYACHLYNALHREKLLKGEWKDMELLLTLHGDGMLVGGRQAPVQEYRENFMISKGVSLTGLSRRRPASRKASGKPERCLETLAPVSRMFANRLFRSGIEQPGLSMSDIDKVVDQSQWHQSDVCWSRKPMAVNNRRANATSTTQTTSGPGELLEHVRDVIDLEFREISIDYFLLYRTTLGLYRAFMDKLDDGLRPQLAKNFGEISAFSLAVEFVLETLGDIKRGSDKGSMAGMRALVSNAAEAMNGITGSDAGEAVSKLLDDERLRYKEETSPGAPYDALSGTAADDDGTDQVSTEQVELVSD